MVGGLKATILTDWIHTFILLIIIIIFSLTAYASSDLLGSPAAVYDLLVQAAQSFPVDGNKDGSYLVSLPRTHWTACWEYSLDEYVGVMMDADALLTKITRQCNPVRAPSFL